MTISSIKQEYLCANKGTFASYGVNRAADKFRLIQKGETKKKKGRKEGNEIL